MNRDELTQLIIENRGLDTEQIIDPLEEWDSLDHLAIVASIARNFPDVSAGVDLSDANSLDKLLRFVSE